MAVDFMQVKMAAVGDDRIRRQMELREDIRSLNMLKNTYLENKYEIEDNIKLLPEKIAKTEKIIEGIVADTKAIKAYVPKKDIDGKEVFEMKVGNTLYTDKKEAAEAFMTAMTKAVIGNPKNPTDIAEYKGFKIAVSYGSFSKSYIGHIKGANRYPFDLGSSESGNLTRIRMIQCKICRSGLVPKSDDITLWSMGLPAYRIRKALNKWKVELFADDLYRFTDLDDPDLKLILDSFDIRIPVKLFRKTDLKSQIRNINVTI